ncbi:ABC transporter permease [Vallicoccus soli]|uniref:ABC transporter permease n=1 Tax=Vallicoccus soli TaxID=2339232 RepID=A0A3A3YWA8_9ACTN|nr:ABC transporter permease [Vallicoccus soli]RJK94199.1 ABC transporter permease [Vallicoccus soli]
MTTTATATGTAGGTAPRPPAPGGRGSGSRAVRIVAEREVAAKLRDKAFLASLAFTLVIIVGGIGIQALIGGGGPERYEVAVTDAGGRAAVEAADAASAAAAPEGEDADPRFTVVDAADARAAEAALDEGDADVALLPAGGGGSYELVGDTAVPDGAATLLRQAVATAQLDAGLQDLGASAQERQELLAGTPVGERLLDPDGEEGRALVLSIAFSVLLFYSVFLFGMGIAQSVTEEKQSRVVELLVAAVPMRALLAGKVLGNTVLAVAQLVLLVGVGMLAASVAGQGELVSLIATSSPWFLVFFLLGFLMLACVWAAAGALASRQEDLQSTTLPLQAVVLVPFFVAVYATGPALVVASWVPFSAPFTMPRRLLTGDAAWWEGVASAGLVALTAVLLVALAARLYQGSLLQTRTRSSWRGAWAAAGRDR